MDTWVQPPALEERERRGREEEREEGMKEGGRERDREGEGGEKEVLLGLQNPETGGCSWLARGIDH